jgi:hypothetical protein
VSSLSGWFHPPCHNDCCVVSFITARLGRATSLTLILISLFIQFIALCSYPVKTAAVISNIRNGNEIVITIY